MTSPKKLHGLTVVELLVTIALIATLAILIIPAARHATKLTQASRCTNHLRQCGMAMLAYAGEHSGSIHLYSYKTAGTSVEWLRYLTGRVTKNHDRSTGNQGEPIYLASSDVALCPGIAPFRYPANGSNQIYGASTRNELDPFASAPPGTSKASNRISINTLQNPSQYWILTDSYHGEKSSQIYVVSRNLKDPYGVHLRHPGGRANLLFVDGHVEAADSQRLKSLPINPFTAGYNAENKPVQF